MINREKVQHGLECCYNGNCGACPYSAIKKCQHELYRDALVMLKEYADMLDAALRFLTEDISSEAMCEYMSCDSGDSWCEEMCEFSSPQRQCWERFLRLGGMPDGQNADNG